MVNKKVIQSYFKNDYRDRGIQKWQGYFFKWSHHHTAKLNKVAKQNMTKNKIKLAKQMPKSMIYQVIKNSLIKHKPIKIQTLTYQGNEEYQG